MSRRLRIPALATALVFVANVLAACGSSGHTTVQAFGPYSVPRPAPTSVSSNPTSAGADRACRSVIPALRSTIATAYTLYPESLSPADLHQTAASYAAAGHSLHRLTRGLRGPARADVDVRSLRVGLDVLGNGLTKLAQVVTQFAAGSGPDVPAAQAAIESDLSALQPAATQYQLPDCSP